MTKKLTREFIALKAKSDRLESITKLNLWGCDLTDVSILSSMPNLKVISLSVNKIRTLKPFANSQNLEELYLRKNAISSLNELKYLQSCPNLKVLWLSENPIDSIKNYRKVIIRMFPDLVKLDDVIITENEREQALNHNEDDNDENEDYEDEQNDDFKDINEYNNSQVIQQKGRFNKEQRVANEEQYNNANYEDDDDNYQEPKYNNKYNPRSNDNIEYESGKINKKSIMDKRGLIRRKTYDVPMPQTHNFKKNYDFYDNQNDNYDDDRYEKPTFKKKNLPKRNYNEHEDFSQMRQSKQSNVQQGSNVLKSILLLLKELNLNELNVVREEVYKQINEY